MKSLHGWVKFHGITSFYILPPIHCIIQAGSDQIEDDEIIGGKCTCEQLIAINK